MAFYFCPLIFAFCLLTCSLPLPAAYHLLPTAYCLLAYCFLTPACGRQLSRCREGLPDRSRRVHPLH